MKLQHLAVIFLIIILPIAMVLSTYTDGLIKVIDNQTHYDEVLSNATYDAIRAYQLNTLHNSFASVNNSRERDITASVNSFFNSLSLGLGMTGYAKEELNEYIPAMLFTLYDGYYVYGPFKNTTSVGEPTELGNAHGLKRAKYSTGDNTKLEYGLMPYTYYSCEYEGITGGNSYDIVVNYSLDNYISVSGKYGDKYFTAAGYYINPEGVDININRTVSITRNGNIVTIEPETLGEYISFTDEIKVENVNGTSTRIVKQAVNETPIYYNYINYNETKYYLEPNTSNLSEETNTSYGGIPIFYIDNDVRVFINRNMLEQLAKYTGLDNPDDLYNINNFKDTNAYHYYKDAKAFSESVYPYLKDIDIKEKANGTYGNVKSEFFNRKYKIYPNDNSDDVNSAHVKISYSELSKANPFDYKQAENNPEEEISIFNNHRIDVIVSSIEATLINSIGNFNNYVSNTFSYAMPTLSENDWYKIANNVTTVSFMQGLPIGKYKFYSNYAAIANKKNKEFISRDSIYVQDNVINQSQDELNNNYVSRSTPEFHSPSCEEYNKNEHEGTGVIGYRNIDYEEEPVLNTYPVLQNGKIPTERIERTQSINYYFQPGTGAYECIISRNENRITTDDLISQRTNVSINKPDGTYENLHVSRAVQIAYITALAREKGASYRNHSGLNYHRYMQTPSGILGENTDKTFNSIDQNFSDENKLNVPSVSD